VTAADLPIATESAEQKSVISWWAIMHRNFALPECILMACPAQAARTPQGGARIKAEGYRAGTPDLFRAASRRGCHGLFVEMKRRDGGTLSENQKQMLFELGAQGYAKAVACGASEAIKVISEYLNP